MSDPLNAIRKLHRLYASESEMVDASRLAYLLGPSKEWSEEEVAELWKDAAAASASGSKNTIICMCMYLFCKSICSFCNYERLRPSRPDCCKNIWIDACRALSGSPQHTIAELPFSVFWWWHAIYLACQALGSVVAQTECSFPVAQACFSTVYRSGHLESTQARGAASPWLARFSFGLQTLDAAVNKAHNRGPQGLEY